eukprot:4444229-Pyramimonas_sp.AAC.1
MESVTSPHQKSKDILGSQGWVSCVGGHTRTLPLLPTVSDGEGGVRFARELPSEVNPTLLLRTRG